MRRRTAGRLMLCTACLLAAGALSYLQGSGCSAEDSLQLSAALLQQSPPATQHPAGTPLARSGPVQAGPAPAHHPRLCLARTLPAAGEPRRHALWLGRGEPWVW